MTDSTESLSVKGFKVAAVDAGIRAAFDKPPQPDLTLVVSDRPCTAAGMFTSNRVKAAPVLVDLEHLATHDTAMRAVLVNTATANACTGEQGMTNARQSAALVAEAVGCDQESVLVLSTGVIGTQLPMAQFQSGVPQAFAALKETAWPAAASAIMTTDTKPKLAAAEFGGITVIGMAKGAGMIAPNMATMLALIVTDADVAPETLRGTLLHAIPRSFNRIVIDGDMSTNDTVLILANGASGVKISSDNTKLFTDAVTEICRQLAWKIVADGEGVTKKVILQVVGASAAADARQIADTIATSPLVKTAFYGGDPNWGRIAMAAGRAGVALDQDRLSLWYDELQLMENGAALDYDETLAKRIAGQSEFSVRLDLGMGRESAEVWTCDLSHDYVSINGHYRS